MTTWRIGSSRVERFTLITVVGEIEHADGDRVSAALASAIAAANRRGAIIDLSRLEFGDSLVLAIMAAAHSQAVDRGLPLAWVAPSGPFATLLGIAGLSEVLALHDDLDQARRRLDMTGSGPWPAFAGA
ncbi:MAG: STAS domain-containing protein [Streptosporangiaceae bacterium]